MSLKEFFKGAQTSLNITSRRMLHNTSLAVLIASMSPEGRGAQPDDLYFRLGCHQGLNTDESNTLLKAVSETPFRMAPASALAS